MEVEVAVVVRIRLVIVIVHAGKSIVLVVVLRVVSAFVCSPRRSSSRRDRSRSRSPRR
jgi:hypothetical protein